jgi:hypothetical protein
MNQSRTNAFGFEKKIPVFATVFGRTPSGVTEYVSGRMSGLATAVEEGTGVGVGRYSGASTLHPDRMAARRAPVRTRRIASSLDPRRAPLGG